MKEVKHYVCGFAFSRDRQHLVLIHKLTPEWQNGLLNGVGGKVENTDISFLEAMVREFREETGVDTLERRQDWKYFASMTFEEDVMGGTAMVHYFKLYSNLIFQCKTVEKEEIEIFKINDKVNSPYTPLTDQPIVSSLEVLIPIALDDDYKFTHFQL